MLKGKQQVSLGLILLGALTIAGILLSLRLENPGVRGMAELVPASRVGFFAEIDLSEKNNEPYANLIWDKLWEKSGEGPEFFAENIGPWWDKHAAEVFLGDAASPLFIFKMQEPEKARAFLEQHAKERLAQFFAYKSFVLFSSDAQVLDSAKTFLISPKDPLGTDAHFSEIFGNFPRFAAVKFYAAPSFGKIFEPYLAFGGIIQNEPGKGLEAQMVALLKNRSSSIRRYEGNLLKYFPAGIFGPAFFLAGNDLPAHFSGNRELLETFGNELLARFQQYGAFGESDLESFFEGEYSLAAYPKDRSGGNFDYLLVTEFPEKNGELFKKLKSRMAEALAYAAPELRRVTLQDSTRGQEFFANTENIFPHEESIAGKTATVFDVKNRPWDLFIVQDSGLLFVSTDREILSQSLEAGQGFQKSQEYASLREVLRGVSDTLFVKTDFLQKQFGVAGFAGLFSSVSASENFTGNALRLYLYAQKSS